jgi:DNA mismatch repair protein MutS2
VDATTLEALEYPAILKELSGFCATPLGSNLALGLKPLSGLDAVKGVYQEYSEVFSIIDEAGRLPLGGISDIRPLLLRHFPVGAYFPVEELLQIRSTIDSIVLLKKTLAFAGRFPLTSARLEAVGNYGELLGELKRIIDERGHIVDNASFELKRIRGEIKSEKARARELLDGLLRDKDKEEVLQEELVTIREDRYVLAVKAGKHTELPGVVHGRSGSGATYFIEPMPLVEMNNRLSILKRDEAAEEIEILKSASSSVLERKAELLADLASASELDLLQAKALFAGEVGGVVPELNTSGDVSLIGARHPLLVLKERSGGPEAVPVDVIMEEATGVLVISGANTGGKTVALKTLGLLTLLALSAVPVPAENGSRVAAFFAVYADIGDRQNIIDSLSTFSAHIKRLDEFLKKARPGSLVLIDEIGVGTDPSEGSALALAALETLRELGAKTVITTHLNILKAHAARDPAYLNASVEFDEDTLRPLYRLRYGVPGSSLGLSIAEGLGMPGGLIERARSYLTGEEGAFMESLRALEAEREEAERAKERLVELEDKKKEALRRLTEDRGRILDKVKTRIDTIVGKADSEIREAVGRFREERSEKAAARASKEVTEISRRVTERVTRTKRYVPEVGDRVSITGSRTKGVVVRVDPESKKAELLAGRMKVWADFNKLVKTGSTASDPLWKGGKGGKGGGGGYQDVHINADIEVSSTLNLVGMRVDEAIKLLEKFLDNAHAGALEKVQVIHGVGTGALAGAVDEFLGSSSIVKGFYRGDPLSGGGGGGGVTIVELK